jgi:hypothetical protein
VSIGQQCPSALGLDLVLDCQMRAPGGEVLSGQARSGKRCKQIIAQTGEFRTDQPVGDAAPERKGCCNPDRGRRAHGERTGANKRLEVARQGMEQRHMRRHDIALGRKMPLAHRLRPALGRAVELGGLG